MLVPHLVRPALGLVAIAAALASAPAHAATRASATLSDLQLTLVDLDPLDGVAPWLQYRIPAFTDMLSVYGSNPGSQNLFAAGEWPPTLGTGALELEADGVHGRFSSVGSGSLEGYHASAFSETRPPTVAAGSFHAGIVFYAMQPLLVSPRTEVVVTGRLRASVDFDAGPGRGGGDATAALSVSDPLRGQLSEWVRVQLQSGSSSEDRLATLTISNAGDDAYATSLAFSTFTSASAIHAAPPVPEPATWVLSLAGGAVLLRFVRRRPERR